MDSSPVSRRQVLSAVGISSVSGCLSAALGSSDEGIRLGTLFFLNSSDESQSVQFELHRNDELVYEDNLELKDGESDSIDPSWSTDPADYRILFATGDELGEVSLPDDYTQVGSTDCYHPNFYFSPVRGFAIEVFNSSDGENDDFEGIC